MAYEQIWVDTNQYGQQQTYRIGCDCIKQEVCSSCHNPYTNLSGKTICRDCQGGEDREEDDPFYESINEHGFPQTYQRSDDSNPDAPVCSQCHAYVMPNQGGGTACGTCQHDFLLECQYDAETYFL